MHIRLSSLLLAILICTSFLFLLINPVQATTETRYFRADLDENDVLILNSTDDNSPAPAGTVGDNAAAVLGIRVYNGSVELTSGVPQAEATVNKGATGWITATGTWTVPANVNPSGTRVTVSVYMKLSGGSYELQGTWETEVLTDTQLDAVLWTVSYHVSRYRYSSTSYDYTFYYADGYSKIANFQHSTPSAGAWNTVVTWSIFLVSRSWQSSGTWSDFLVARMWQNSGVWSDSLISRAWQNVGFWSINLLTLGWHTVISWSILLLGEDPTTIVVILFLFSVVGFTFFGLYRRKKKDG